MSLPVFVFLSGRWEQKTRNEGLDYRFTVTGSLVFTPGNAIKFAFPNRNRGGVVISTETDPDRSDAGWLGTQA